MNPDSFFSKLRKDRDALIAERAKAAGLTPDQWRQRNRERFSPVGLTGDED